MLVIGDAASVPKMEDNDEYCNTEERLGVSILPVRHIHSRFVISWKGLRELVTLKFGVQSRQSRFDSFKNDSTW